jgi:predicted TIM-barrel fold metal-dependent hydrolase
MFGKYELSNLWQDTDSGHNIEKTVFIDCHSNYRKDGPLHLRPVGETEYVAEVAAQSAAQAGKADIAGIVGHANMELGAAAEEVLLAHEAAGNGLFRGIRHAGASDDSGALSISGGAAADLYARPEFRAGITKLGEMGYSYDTWHYHTQNLAFLDLARAVPGTQMILDHFGTPLGVGPWSGKREAVFEQWQSDIAAIATCGNVVAKLGGLAMPDNGFGWHQRETPPTSDEFVAAQERYFRHTIDCFGPERCMFESNFPVDRMSISYHVLWNGMKKIAASYYSAEQHAMFYGTAKRVYRL